MNKSSIRLLAMSAICALGLSACATGQISGGVSYGTGSGYYQGSRVYQDPYSYQRYPYGYNRYQTSPRIIVPPPNRYQHRHRYLRHVPSNVRPPHTRPYTRPYVRPGVRPGVPYRHPRPE